MLYLATQQHWECAHLLEHILTLGRTRLVLVSHEDHLRQLFELSISDQGVDQVALLIGDKETEVGGVVVGSAKELLLGLY